MGWKKVEEQGAEEDGKHAISIALFSHCYSIDKRGDKHFVVSFNHLNCMWKPIHIYRGVENQQELVFLAPVYQTGRLGSLVDVQTILLQFNVRLMQNTKEEIEGKVHKLGLNDLMNEIP